MDLEGELLDPILLSLFTVWSHQINLLFVLATINLIILVFEGCKTWLGTQVVTPDFDNSSGHLPHSIQPLTSYLPNTASVSLTKNAFSKAPVSLNMLIK